MYSGLLMNIEKKTPIIRIVVDSNIIISAFNFGGLPARVVSSSLQSSVELYLSRFILNEVAGVLEKKFDWQLDKVHRALQSLTEQAQIVTPRDRVGVARDENDNRILECALAAQAHYLISGDDDLLSLKKYSQTKIVTPAHFLSAIRKK